MRYQVRGPIDKPKGLFLSVDYEDAPVPQNFYVADYFEVHEQDLTVVLIFGRADAEEGSLRSKVEIVFPAVTFVAQLWRSSRDFHETLRSTVKDLGSSPAIPSKKLQLAGDKVHTAQSNNVLMLVTGSESLMDFFYISPKDMWSKPRRGEDIPLEPIVRVITPPSLLLGFLDVCEPVAKRLGERFGKYLREEPHDNLESA